MTYPMLEWRKKNPERAREHWKKQNAKRIASGKNAEAQREYRVKNRERVNTNRRAYRAANPDYERRLVAKIRSTIEGTLKLLCRKRGRKQLSSAALLQMFYKQQGLCTLSGVRMTWGGNGRVPTHVSIDRIDSTKDYTIGNVQLVCCAVNIMKSNMQEYEFIRWCKQVARHL